MQRGGFWAASRAIAEDDTAFPKGRWSLGNRYNERVDYRRIASALEPYYVYLLIDPRSDEPFYVGKGRGRRYRAHFDEAYKVDVRVDPETIDHSKIERIREILDRGEEPRVDIVRYGLDENTALEVEATLIDCLPRLTNVVRGHGQDRGRLSLEEFERRHGAPYLDTDLRAILIKLNDWQDEVREDLGRRGFGYYQGMSDDDLYLSTRGIWRVDRGVVGHYPYAVAVYAGITRAVWEIDHERWSQFPDAKGELRWGWAARDPIPLQEGAAWEAFGGPRGRRIPEKRSGGGAVFGNQAPVAYWPNRANHRTAGEGQSKRRNRGVE